MKIGAFKIMDRFEVPNLDDPTKNYLSRLRIIECPWFGVLLHRFDGPDSRPTLHDHPWSFVSIILRGGYYERRWDCRDRDTIKLRRIRFVNVMRRDDAHYIESLTRTPSWSLLLIGNRRRTWGYWRWTGEHWTWHQFDTDEHAVEFDLAMAARAAGLSGSKGEG